MPTKRSAGYLAGGAAAAAATAMFTVAPAGAEGDIYVAACGSNTTQLGYIGEDSTERGAIGKSQTAANSAGDSCDEGFGTAKNECLAVARSDTGTWFHQVRRSWVLAEEAALTQIQTAAGPGHSVVVRCAGGGPEPAAAQAPEPAPKPEPEPAGPCIPDPFNLNFPGAC